MSCVTQLLFKKQGKRRKVTWSNKIISIPRKKKTQVPWCFFFFLSQQTILCLWMLNKKGGGKRQNTVSAFLRPKHQTRSHPQPSLDLCDPLGLKGSRTQFLCNCHKLPEPLVFFPGHCARFLIGQKIKSDTR